MEVVVEPKTTTSSAAVYLAAALFGFIVGFIIAFIYIAFKESAITPQLVACNANNFLYSESQKIPTVDVFGLPITIAPCLPTYLGISPQVCVP
jgi:hypothetical protein